MSNNGSTITGYIVTPVLQGSRQKPARVQLARHDAVVLGGLANGHLYTFKIAAKNANGIGIASALTSPVIVGTPAPPTGVHPVRVSSGRFKVNFSPGSSNGAPVTKYAANLHVVERRAHSGDHRAAEPDRPPRPDAGNVLHVQGEGDEQPGNRATLGHVATDDGLAPAGARAA